MRCQGLVVILSIAGTLAGCSEIQHNDVLIFGTQTKFGVDVSASAEQGGIPEFTFGYKRKEAVWMPLYPNAVNSRLVPGSVTRSDEASGTSTTSNPDLKGAHLEKIKYVGSAKGFKSELGEPSDEKDSYSVFASFGARGDATGGGSAALAQFFATGIAAQRLGSNPRATYLVAAQGVDANVVAEARARADAEAARANAEAQRVQALSEAYGITADEVAAALEQGDLDKEVAKGKRAIILKHIAPSGSLDEVAKKTLNQILEKIKTTQNLSEVRKNKLRSAKNLADLDRQLRRFRSGADAIFDFLYMRRN